MPLAGRGYASKPCVRRSLLAAAAASGALDGPGCRKETAVVNEVWEFRARSARNDVRNSTEGKTVLRLQYDFVRSGRTRHRSLNRTVHASSLAIQRLGSHHRFAPLVRHPCTRARENAKRVTLESDRNARHRKASGKASPVAIRQRIVDAGGSHGRVFAVPRWQLFRSKLVRQRKLHQPPPACRPSERTGPVKGSPRTRRSRRFSHENRTVRGP